MSAWDLLNTWPADQIAAGWRRSDGTTKTVGSATQPYALASVTKPLVALAVLVAVEEGTLALDQPAGPEGATVAHLLSHSSGLGAEYGDPVMAAQQRRIYSNAGFEELGRILSREAQMPVTDYFRDAVVTPLGLQATWLAGSPAHGAVSCLADLLRVVQELQSPTLIHPVTLQQATRPVFPDLSGVLPGFGRQDPNPWGLGFEIRGSKSPHWTGRQNSPDAFGHFGAAGTFMFVDPHAAVGCVALTDHTFGPWAAQAWPPFCDAVIDDSGSQPESASVTIDG